MEDDYISVQFVPLTNAGVLLIPCIPTGFLCSVHQVEHYIKT